VIEGANSLGGRGGAQEENKEQTNQVEQEGEKYDDGEYMEKRKCESGGRQKKSA